MQPAPVDGGAPAIHGFLSRVRGRLLRIEAVSTLALALAATGGCLLALLLIAMRAQPSASWPLVAGMALVLALAAGVARGILRQRRWRSPEALARFVGGARPEVSSALLSAVQLSHDLDQAEREAAGGAPMPFSRDLAVAHLRATAEQLGAASPAELAPWAGVQPYVSALSAVIIAFALLAWRIPEGLQRAAAVLRGQGAEQVAVSTEPIVADLNVELHFPAYLARPVARLEASTGDFRAPRGTRVVITARPLVQGVTAARLELGTGSAAGTASAAASPPAAAAPKKPAPPPPQVEVQAGGRLRATFVVAGDGQYRFVLQRGSAAPQAEPDWHRLAVEPDLPPRVEIFAPSPDLELDTPRPVEVGYLARDDFGLAHVWLVARPGKGKEVRQLLFPAPVAATPPPDAAEGGAPTPAAPTPTPERTKIAEGRTLLDLARLKLEPGKPVSYWIEAEDNDDVSGPKKARSRTFTVKVNSPEDAHSQVLKEQQELLWRTVDLLGDRMQGPTSTLWTEKPGGAAGSEPEPSRRPRSSEDFRVAAARTLELVASFGKLETALAKDRLASQDVAPQLARVRQKLDALARSELREAGSTPLPQLVEQNGKQTGELERASTLLDNLLTRQRLEELVRLGQKIQQARDRVAELLKKFKETKDPALKEEIERELAAIEQQIRELGRRMAELMRELPPEFLNSEAVAAKALPNAMQQIRDKLAKGDIDGALEALDRMKKDLGDMMEQLDGDLGGLRGQRFAENEKALSELMDRVQALTEQEKKLLAETQEALKQAESRGEGKQRAEALKEAQSQVDRLRKELQGVEPRALSPFEQEGLEAAKGRLRQLELLLKSGDVGQGTEQARRLERAVRELADDLAEDASDPGTARARGADPRRAQQSLDRGKRPAKRLVELMEQAQRSGTRMSPEDQKRLGDLARRQEQNRRAAEEVRQQAQRQAGRLPGVAQPADKLLGEVEQAMRRASDRLGQGDPRRATSDEQGALDKLTELRKKIDDSRKPKPSQGQGQVDRRPVRIPGADEFRAPKEFREDLLDAMKEAPPAAYKERVKRYYDELVR